MTTDVSELLAAYPDDDSVRVNPAQQQLEELMRGLAHRPVPTGAFRRAWALSGLHANVAMAYLGYWVRGVFQSSEEKKRRLVDTHLRAAFKILREMGYLRGAVMKLGQTIANFPDVAPVQFVETLEKLHFEAPPMHFSLLREQVRSELGGDPEDIFASFETRAFAAASLGQVHRAVLKSGEPVAIKIQYPGIGKTVRSDFRNLNRLMAPLRLTKDWESLKGMLDDVQRMVELESDYEIEARTQRKVRELFREDDGIVIPRVYDQFSTPRILTTEFIDGVHIQQFMRQNPSQELCDSFGAKIGRALARIYFAGKVMYTDIHPGNLVFVGDGRLGLLDFGAVRDFANEWEEMRLAWRAVAAGGNDWLEFISQAVGASSVDQLSVEQLKILEDHCNWCWEPYRKVGLFDFGNHENFQTGFRLVGEAMRKRCTRGPNYSTAVNRFHFGSRAMLYRLRARVEMKAINDEEMRVTGWSGAVKQ